MQPIQALLYLSDTIIQMLALLLLLRVLLQWVRADFYNTLVQIIVRITNPILLAFRKIIPSIGRLDVPGLICFYALHLIAYLLRFAASDVELSWQTVLFLAFQRSIHTVLMTYLILIFANVLLSWFGQQARHPIIPLIYQLTEPVLRPIRKILPNFAGLDLSPLIAIIGINFLMVLVGWR